jgi:hypothetical protein
LQNVVLSFLEVPDTVRFMLVRNPSDPMRGSKMDLAAYSLAEAASLNADETRVLSLLEKLKEKVERVAALESFQEAYFEQMPRLSSAFIQTLLVGKHEGGGLIAACGNYEDSPVASHTALKLLCRLMDPELNSEAQVFLDVMARIPPVHLATLQLHRHILSTPSELKLNTFRFISLLLNGLPTPVAIEQLVEDTGAREEYLTWGEVQGAVQVSHTLEVPSKRRLHIPNISDHDYKQVAFAQSEKLLEIASDPDGWRPVICIAAAAAAKEDVSLFYKKDVDRDAVMVRLQTVLPFAPSQVLPWIADLRLRKQWDLKLHAATRTVKLDKSTDVTHWIGNSTKTPHKFRDFCLLRSVAMCDDGESMLAVSGSVAHTSVPETPDAIRAVCFATGYILSPCVVEDRDEGKKWPSSKLTSTPKPGSPSASRRQGSLLPILEKEQNRPETHWGRDSEEQYDAEITGSAASSFSKHNGATSVSCRLTMLTHTDNSSALIFSSDLLGETDELRDMHRQLGVCLHEQLYGS